MVASLWYILSVLYKTLKTTSGHSGNYDSEKNEKKRKEKEMDQNGSVWNPFIFPFRLSSN